MNEKVVITGMGAVTPVGLGVGATWRALVEGRSGIGPITKFDASAFDTRIAGELKGFDPGEYMDRKEAKRADPFTQYAIAAAKEAMEQSGLDTSEQNGNRIGCIIGSGIGGLTTWEAQHSILLEKGPSRVSPFFIPMMIADMASGQVSMIYGARGTNFAIVSACASGAHAIGEAFRLIRLGELDAAIAGGSEATITPMALAGFCSLKALCPRATTSPSKASRPFDRDRDGFVLGEGAGVVILESESHAQARGADILAELAGLRLHRRCAPHHGAAAGRRRRGAGHGPGAPIRRGASRRRSTTSTPTARPRSSTTSSRRWPSTRSSASTPRKLAVSSTKSMTGHLLGGAGAVETGGDGDGGAGEPAPADHQPRNADPGVRSRLRAQSGTPSARCGWPSAIPSDSAGTTSPSPCGSTPR